VLLNDEKTLTALAKEMVVEGCGKEIDTIAHHFKPQGVSIIVMLEESHISIHTYPEFEMAFIDIFVCGERAEPYKALKYIINKFKPRFSQINTIKRE
jgi:S-adenosylmethionine decarboxylase